MGTKGIKLLFAGNLQQINIDKINVPAPLNDALFDQQAFSAHVNRHLLLLHLIKIFFSRI